MNRTKFFVNAFLVILAFSFAVPAAINSFLPQPEQPKLSAPLVSSVSVPEDRTYPTGSGVEAEFAQLLNATMIVNDSRSFNVTIGDLRSFTVTKDEEGKWYFPGVGICKVPCAFQWNTYDVIVGIDSFDQSYLATP